MGTSWVSSVSICKFSKAPLLSGIIFACVPPQQRSNGRIGTDMQHIARSRMGESADD